MRDARSERRAHRLLCSVQNAQDGTRQSMKYAPVEHISDESQAGQVANVPCPVCKAYPGNQVQLRLLKYPFNETINACAFLWGSNNKPLHSSCQF